MHQNIDQKIVQSLVAQLKNEYGKGFSKRNILYMMQFAKTFPEKKIVVSVVRQLSWTHILVVIPIDDPLKREFYIEMCKLEKWSVREFRKRINSMLYERTAISRKPEETIINDLELYLRWLEKYETVEGENKPIGLILCAAANEQHVELLQLDKSNIRVGEYLTRLPDKKTLENKLFQAIERAKSRLSI
jgi:hypothetical protein